MGVSTRQRPQSSLRHLDYEKNAVKKGKPPSTTTPSVDSFEKARRFTSDGAKAKVLEPTALDDERGVKDVLAGGGRMVEHFKQSQLADCRCRLG